MNINFELYRIFYVVANNKNITKAANELNISQPAISKSIKKLEDKLGGQLFIRSKRGVTLTEEGKEFYKYIKEAMDYINNAENKFTELINLERGSIRIGTTTSITKKFLLKYLKEYHMKYPNIDIKIVMNPPDEMISQLKKGLLDIVIFNIIGKDYGKEIKLIKCKKVESCFISSYKYRELCNKKISLKDLSKYPMVLQAKGSNTRYLLDNYAKSLNIELNPNIELASNSLIVDFVKIGFGVGLVTREYLDDNIDNSNIFEINLEEKLPTRYIGLAISNINTPNFSTQKLIELINKNC